MSSGLVIVAGAGAGLGEALVTRFGSGGYTAIGLTRSGGVDLSDENTASAALTELIAEHGAPKVVIHNTAELVISDLAHTSVEDFERCWSSIAKTAFILAQATMQPMVQAGGGAFLVSGATASLRGGARFAAFASAKFALRGLTQALAREHQSAGIHVAHVILDGIIDTDKSRALHAMDAANMMKTDDIAEAYWQLAHQPRSTWSHEVDLRPASESF